MAQNKLEDLSNHLFAQLERLGSEELTEEQLKKEINRAKAISSISKDVISNAQIVLDAAKFKYKYLPGNADMPEQFRLTD